MAQKERVATWMELAVVSAGARESPQLHAHPVGGDGGACMTLSLNGRLLYDTSQRMTVFRSVGAVSRFLSLSGHSGFRIGASLPFEIACGDDVRCLCLRRNQHLGRCGLSDAKRKGKAV